MKTALLILAAAFLISASVVSTTFKPAQPVAVRHDSFANINRGGVDEFIGQCIRDGYVIKIISANEYGWIVVAEKY